MPPRRRTFYLADATALSNGKVRRLARQHPDDWLSAWGAFHILIGVATLNGSPRLTDDDIVDALTPDFERLVPILREAGFLTRTGIDAKTFAEWCPKPRPKYPSDRKGSDGDTTDSDGVGSDSAGVDGRSEGTPTESPTTTSTSSSSSTTGSTSSTPVVDRFPPLGSRNGGGVHLVEPAS